MSMLKSARLPAPPRLAPVAAAVVPFRIRCSSSTLDLVVVAAKEVRADEVEEPPGGGDEESVHTLEWWWWWCVAPFIPEV